MKYVVNRTLLIAPIVALAAVLALFVAGPLSTFVHSPTPLARAVGTDLGAFSGYAWSDNMGWISLSGSTYQVAIKSDNTLYGYAWANPSDDVSGSNNIGWISFNAADTASCGSVATLTGTTITGWAKVLSPGANVDWNGCISLSGSSPAYGVTLGSSGSSQSGTLNGYAWADSTVGGWISFNCATGGPTGNNICATSNYAATYTTATAPPPPPTTSITSFTGPNRVRSGGTAVLKYIVVSPPSSCTITGSNGYSSGTISPIDGVLGSVTTTAITANTLFTLTCGSVSLSKTVGITPTTVEK